MDNWGASIPAEHSWWLVTCNFLCLKLTSSRRRAETWHPSTGENAISLFRQCVFSTTIRLSVENHRPRRKEATQMKILYVTHKHWKVISLYTRVFFDCCRRFLRFYIGSISQPPFCMDYVFTISISLPLSPRKKNSARLLYCCVPLLHYWCLLFLFA